MNKETAELIRQAREYSDNDEYHVTRNLLRLLCNKLESYDTMYGNLMYKIAYNYDTFKNSERYLWLKNNAWEIPVDEVAPCVVQCNGDMSKYDWLIGKQLDDAIDYYMEKELKETDL